MSVNKEEINFLELTPIPKVEYERKDEETIYLLIPKFGKRLPLQLLLPKTKSPYIKLHLDAIGTATWQLIDGEKTVSEICNLLKSQYGKELVEAEERVTKFLSKLYKEKYLSFKEIDKVK